jgi:hypothetical protein
VRSRLLGRLVTSPIAFLVGGIADFVIYAIGSLRSAWRRVI